MTMRSPSMLTPCERNGSGHQIASTWPLFRAVRIDGNGIATSLIELGSTPAFWSGALMTTSPTPLSAFAAIVLPARSDGERIDELPLTRMSCQLSDVDV